MLPLSAAARQAVDRIDAHRRRQRDLRIRRDTAIRARVLEQEARDHAERASAVWAPENHVPAARHRTDSVPSQVLAYLHEHGEAHTSRIALSLNRSYDATRQALGRLEQAGEVVRRDHKGTRWWRLHYENPTPDRRRPHPNQKLDADELVEHVTAHPGCTVYEAATVFDAHPETVGRRFRELRAEGRLVDVVRDRAAASQWYPAGEGGPRRPARPVVHREELVRFVAENPGCTTVEAACALGGHLETVRRVLNKLAHAGRVRNGAAGSNVARWEAL